MALGDKAGLREARVNVRVADDTVIDTGSVRIVP